MSTTENNCKLLTCSWGVSIYILCLMSCNCANSYLQILELLAELQRSLSGWVLQPLRRFMSFQLKLLWKILVPYLPISHPPLPINSGPLRCVERNGKKPKVAWNQPLRLISWRAILPLKVNKWVETVLIKVTTIPICFNQINIENDWTLSMY